MASITYNGHDFAKYTSAETVLKSAQTLRVVSEAIPGSSRRYVTNAEVEPFEVGVKLMLKPECRTTDEELMEVRRTLRAWLMPPDMYGVALTLPEEPGLEWRHAYPLDVDDWDALFEDGECSLCFAAYDPIAYGEKRTVNNQTTLYVQGTYPTWPVVTLTTEKTDSIAFGLADNATPRVVIEHDFIDGDEVTIDMERQDVWINGTLCDVDVTLLSDFFRLVPGSNAFCYAGVKHFTVNFTERWI